MVPELNLSNMWMVTSVVSSVCNHPPVTILPIPPVLPCLIGVSAITLHTPPYIAYPRQTITHLAVLGAVEVLLLVPLLPGLGYHHEPCVGRGGVDCSSVNTIRWEEAILTPHHTIFTCRILLLQDTLIFYTNYVLQTPHWFLTVILCNIIDNLLLLLCSTVPTNNLLLLLYSTVPTNNLLLLICRAAQRVLYTSRWFQCKVRLGDFHYLLKEASGPKTYIITGFRVLFPVYTFHFNNLQKSTSTRLYSHSFLDICL